jgi:hypothetical protein
MPASSNGSRNYACPLYQQCLDFWARRDAPSLPCNECDLSFSKAPVEPSLDDLLGCLRLVFTIEYPRVARGVIEDMVGSWMEKPEDNIQRVPFRRPYYDIPISEWAITPVTVPLWLLPDRKRRR